MNEHDDVAKLFESKLSDSASKSGRKEGESYSYHILDACRGSNRGTIVGRYVPDSKKEFYREIESPIEIKVPVTSIGKDGSPETKRVPYRYIPDDQYKCILTPEEKILNETLKTKIGDLHSLDEDGIWIYNPTKMFIFYMKISSIIPVDQTKYPAQDFPNPKITAIWHKSANFAPGFKAAYDARVRLKRNSDWLKDFLNRDKKISQNVIAINTTLKDEGGWKSYVVSMVFDTGPDIGLDDEDLKVSENLNIEFVNCEKYDSELVKGQIIELQKEIDARSQIKKTTASVSEPTKSEGTGLEGMKSANTAPVPL